MENFIRNSYVRIEPYRRELFLIYQSRKHNEGKPKEYRRIAAEEGKPVVI